MKSALFRLLSAMVLLAPEANALVTMHEREALHCSGWSPGLTAIINHPARVSGQVGPLAPSAQLQFAGDAEVFNRVLAQYGALDQKQRVLYLSADTESAGNGWDFELSVTQEGHGFLHLYTPGRIPLAEIKVPAGVAVEALPPTGLPLDPKQRAKLEAGQKRVEDFVTALKAAPGVARTIQPGAPAPRICALAADGSPVEPERSGDLPAAMANMHVLVVFWSLSDPDDAGLVAPLTALYREFRKGRFQIVSICIDNDFAAWLASLADGRRINDRVWWQLTQAGSSADCAATFGVVKTPSAFLIQPNGRFFATHIPAEKLRATVARAMDWDAP
jgi:hypothetical protein